MSLSDIFNEVMSCKKDEQNLRPGICGTKFVGSDRYPVVLGKVLSPKAVLVFNLPSDFIDFIHQEEDGNEYYDAKELAKLIENEYSYMYKLFCKDVAPFETEKLKEAQETANDTFKNAHKYTLRKNGRWLRQGEGLHSTGAVHFGHAESYWDPSF